MASVAHGALEALGVLHDVPGKATPAAVSALSTWADADMQHQMHSYWHLESALAAALASTAGAGSGTVTSLGERLHMQHCVATQRLYRSVFAQAALRKALAAVSSAEQAGDPTFPRFTSYVQQVGWSVGRQSRLLAVAQRCSLRP